MSDDIKVLGTRELNSLSWTIKKIFQKEIYNFIIETVEQLFWDDSSKNFTCSELKSKIFKETKEYICIWANDMNLDTVKNDLMDKS